MARTFRGVCASGANCCVAIGAQNLVLKPGANIIAIDVDNVTCLGAMADRQEQCTHMFAKLQIAGFLTVLQFTTVVARFDA